MELACYCFPYGPVTNYREYTQDELKDPDTVEGLFDLVQIYEASISSAGWRFLIDHHGYEKLYEIDRRSGYKDCESIEEYKAELAYEIETAEKSEAQLEADSEHIDFHVSKERYAEIKAYAAKNRMSLAELFNEALEEYQRSRGDTDLPKYRLRFGFKRYSHCCISSENRAAYERFGYMIQPEKLGLSAELSDELHRLVGLFDELCTDWGTLSDDVKEDFVNASMAAFERTKTELDSDTGIRYKDI